MIFTKVFLAMAFIVVRGDVVLQRGAHRTGHLGSALIPGSARVGAPGGKKNNGAGHLGSGA